MEYDIVLKNIGLSSAEATIYIALLQLGNASPAELARKAGIKRPTLYKHLPKLKEKGLISETVIGRRRRIVAEDPSRLLEERKNYLEKFEEALPALHSLLNTASVKPKIFFYEGVEGLQKMYMETLREKEPIFEFVSLEKISEEMERYSKNYYIPQRVNRNIPIKIIVSGATSSSLLKITTAPHELREVRTIDQKKFPIPLDCYIWGDNIALSLYRKDSEPVGFLIRSIEVATAMKSLFALTWEMVPAST